MSGKATVRLRCLADSVGVSARSSLDSSCKQQRKKPVKQSIAPYQGTTCVLDTTTGDRMSDMQKLWSAVSTHHISQAFYSLSGTAAAREAANMVLARFELFVTLGTKLQFGTVTPFFARTADVRRSSVVHFQSPKLGKAATAPLVWTVKSIVVLSAFDPFILGYVFRTLHSLLGNEMDSSRAQ